MFGSAGCHNSLWLVTLVPPLFPSLPPQHSSAESTTVRASPQRLFFSFSFSGGTVVSCQYKYERSKALDAEVLILWPEAVHSWMCGWCPLSSYMLQFPYHYLCVAIIAHGTLFCCCNLGKREGLELWTLRCVSCRQWTDSTIILCDMLSDSLWYRSILDWSQWWAPWRCNPGPLQLHCRWTHLHPSCRKPQIGEFKCQNTSHKAWFLQNGSLFCMLADWWLQNVLLETLSDSPKDLGFSLRHFYGLLFAIYKLSF